MSVLRSMESYASVTSPGFGWSSTRKRTSPFPRFRPSNVSYVARWNVAPTLNVSRPIVMARSANDGPKLSLLRANAWVVGLNVKVNPPADYPPG